MMRAEFDSIKLRARQGLEAMEDCMDRLVMRFHEVNVRHPDFDHIRMRVGQGALDFEEGMERLFKRFCELYAQDAVTVQVPASLSITVDP